MGTHTEKLVSVSVINWDAESDGHVVKIEMQLVQLGMKHGLTQAECLPS